MHPFLLEKLREITLEEKEILEGNTQLQKKLYSDEDRREIDAFVIDSRHLLEKGRLIEIRPHTRFIHFPRHRHNYVEIVYMCSGSTTHIINNTEVIELKAGDLLFLNQNVTQEILPAGEDDIAVNFIVLPEFFDRPFTMIERENVLRDFLISALAHDGSSSLYLHFQAKDLLPVQNLLENMIWNLFEHRKGTNTINQTTMGLLFMNLSQFAENINQNNPNQYEQSLVFLILKYIETHYKEGSLEDISEELGYPTYYISRLLKRRLNSNFKELLQKRKLQQASYLLTQTTLSISAIMNAIGYENSSYFYRKFREKYGCSPKEYRSASSQ